MLSFCLMMVLTMYRYPDDCLRADMLFKVLIGHGRFMVDVLALGLLYFILIVVFRLVLMMVQKLLGELLLFVVLGEILLGMVLREML